MKHLFLQKVMGLLCSAGIAAMVLGGCASVTSTDGNIHADYKRFEAQQKAIQALNESGHILAAYEMAKAQCWLDVSLHEYTRNDRTAFVPEALNESKKIVAFLKAGDKSKDNPANQTPLINNVEKLRPDLWKQAKNLKQHVGLTCAVSHIACAEVELVHAGNEYRQQGWRHAKPYVQIAEDRLSQAQKAAETCVQKPLAKPIKQ